jgi:hypothetical protein
MVAFAGDVWQWLKDHDTPNWFALFVWPAIIYWWNTRKRQSVPHLEVRPESSQAIIPAGQSGTIELIFTNETESVVYLHRARLRENQKHIPTWTAGRELSGGWRELKFKTSSGEYVHRQCVLQTGSTARTCIPITRPMDDAFYSYRSGWLRRCFRRPKYFRIEYTAMVGEEKYSVATIY